MGNRIKLLRMTDKLEFLIRAIEKGFEVRSHPVSFDIDPKHLPDNVVKHWAAVQFEVPMLCFAELRDVLKIADVHMDKYGRYGMCMKLEWALSHGADRVFYVAPDREFSRRLAIAIGMLGEMPKNGISYQDVYSAVLDLLSFVQPAKDQEDFEWRIVGKHHFSGEDRSSDPVTFNVDDIEQVYVHTHADITVVTEVLKKKAERDGHKGELPPIYLTETLTVAA